MVTFFFLLFFFNFCKNVISLLHCKTFFFCCTVNCSILFAKYSVYVNFLYQYVLFTSVSFWNTALVIFYLIFFLNSSSGIQNCCTRTVLKFSNLEIKKQLNMSLGQHVKLYACCQHVKSPAYIG